MNIYETDVYIAWKRATDDWLDLLRTHIAELTCATYPTATKVQVEIVYGDEMGDESVSLRKVFSGDTLLADNDEHHTSTFDTLADELWEPLNNIHDLDRFVGADDTAEMEFTDTKEA